MNNPKQRRSLRCRLGVHDQRDHRGWPKPDWYVITKPHTYVCTRCGKSTTLRPAHWGAL